MDVIALLNSMFLEPGGPGTRLGLVQASRPGP